MKIVKLIIIILFLMPFLFTIGTIASSAEVLGSVASGNHNIQIKNIVIFGESLKSATKDIVMMEIDIAKNIALYIKRTKPIDTDRILQGVRGFSGVHA
ncbi:MAG: hypothetical protein D4S01_00365 [Dehalococcoidia bacterium]|nr:MAG: hypothetical protein D4S01_00365 [Dehalococcoidia bacterium]